MENIERIIREIVDKMKSLTYNFNCSFRRKGKENGIKGIFEQISFTKILRCYQNKIFIRTKIKETILYTL